MFALMFALVSHATSPNAFRPVQTARETVIVAAPSMLCSAPRPLVQGSGTVRECKVVR